MTTRHITATDDPLPYATPEIRPVTDPTTPAQGEYPTITQIQDELRTHLPEGYTYATCTDFCGDAACGIDLTFELCADEVQVWGDNGWSADILRAIGESLISVSAPAAASNCDGVYEERDRLVAFLASVYPSWLGPVDDPEPGWSSAVYVDTPAGQMSWHIPDHEAGTLFAHVPVRNGGQWDGHTTVQKYQRLHRLTTELRAPAAGEAETCAHGWPINGVGEDGTPCPWCEVYGVLEKPAPADPERP